MRITKWAISKIAAWIALIAIMTDPFGDFLANNQICSDPKDLCSRGISVLFIVGAIILLAVIADGSLYARQELLNRNQEIRSATIAVEPYRFEIGEQRMVGLIIYNNEKKLEMRQFEVWQGTFLSDDVEEGELERIRREIGRSKSKRYSWRVGDSDGDGLVRMEANGGYRELVIARTDHVSNTFTLTFSDEEIAGIPPGTYRMGLGAKGRMPRRRAGLYSFAVRIRYTKANDIRLDEIPLEEANIHIL